MIKKIWLLLFSIFILVYFYLPYVQANTYEKNVESLQNLSQSLYQSVKLKDYEKSKLIIEEMSEIIPSVQYNGLTSVEGIEAIASTVVQTKRSLAAIQPNHETIFYYSTQLHLAVDALSHQGQPLWHRYYSTLRQDIGNMKNAIKEENVNDFHSSLKSFKIHYNLIKPAVLVARKPQSIEKINSLIKALTNQSLEQNKETILKQLDGDIYQLFYNNEKETFGSVMKEAIIWKASIGIGLIIFLVLSYVIWKKFKGSYLPA